MFLKLRLSGITPEKHIEWISDRTPWCDVHESPMEAVSRGIFYESESGKRITYEVLFHCLEKDCKKIALKEWYIKEQHIAFWDLMWFGRAIDPEPFEGESFYAFSKRMEDLYVAFGIATESAKGSGVP